MRTGDRIILLALLIALAGGELYAQRGGRRIGGFSPLSLNYEFIAGAELDGPGPEFNPGAKVELTTLRVKLNLPPIGIRRPGRDREGGTRWSIMHGLAYHQRRVMYENLSITSSAYRLDRLHGAEYQAALLLRPSPKWRTIIQINPGVYSDFEGGADSGHWRVQAGLLLDRVLSGGFVVGLGASWSTSFGDNLLLPLVHLESPFGANPHLRIILPTVTELTWRTGRGLEIGGAVRVDGDRYGLGAFGMTGAAGGIDGLRYSNITAGPFLSAQVGRGWKLMLEGGGTLYRKFETYRNDTMIEDYKLKNSSFFRISLKPWSR
ncbi:MAG: hypothetical protein FVQ81_02685 [Candidatus Glassbacteria bacterium]|nr:hypothetical protein [Candidatus Glassbacteria bacterium]